MLGHLQKILMERDPRYPNDFWHKNKNDNFDPYNVLLAIAIILPMLPMTGFVFQGHRCLIIK